MQTTRSFIGMDVHKATISISIAEDGRDGPVRFLGVIPNAPDEIAKMAKRLTKHGELDFCYEAGGCGYNIYRQLTALGHRCTVAATSLVPRKPGERIPTDELGPPFRKRLRAGKTILIGGPRSRLVYGPFVLPVGSPFDPFVLCHSSLNDRAKRALRAVSYGS